MPPVLLDTEVAHEVYGSAACYAPLDVTRIADALREVLTNDSTRERLRSAGRELLGRYTWTRTASDMLEAIQEATGR